MEFLKACYMNSHWCWWTFRPHLSMIVRLKNIFSFLQKVVSWYLHQIMSNFELVRHKIDLFIQIVDHIQIPKNIFPRVSARRQCVYMYILLLHHVRTSSNEIWFNWEVGVDELHLKLRVQQIIYFPRDENLRKFSRLHKIRVSGERKN